MGICEASSNSHKDFSSLGDASTALSNNKISMKSSKKSLVKRNNGFILPENLSKRDDINKYYKITKNILGEGTSGIVCIGERDGRQYAIKKIRKNKIKEIKPFILEAKISFHLDHENIIKYYEIYEDSQFISYVMDLGEGGDLFDFILGCPLGHLPADIVIDILIQICDAIDYLHSQKGVVHRDLKPENFMIKINQFNKPQVKLIDFGLATYIPKNGERLKEYLGTLKYSAPEICKENGYLEKVDEWAIGIIMYSMLTGYEPFKGNNYKEIKRAIIYSKINFEKIEDNDLREINEKLLNKDEDKRISCKEAFRELKRIKVERENYYKGFKRLSKKTPSVILKKENEELPEYSNYWEQMTTNAKNKFTNIN